MANGIVDANGVTLRHDRIGKSEDPACSLLPVRTDKAVAWTFASARCSDRGFQLLRFDQRDTDLSGSIPDDERFNERVKQRYRVVT